MELATLQISISLIKEAIESYYATRIAHVYLAYEKSLLQTTPCLDYDYPDF